MTGRFRSSARAALAAGLVSAGLSRLGADPRVRRRAARWTRTNHAGAEVTLLEGPAVVIALLVGLTADTAASTRTRAAVGLAAVVAGAVGAYDDAADLTADLVAGESGRQAKGFRGHLTALAEGRVTGGAIKIIGIGAGAAVAAAVLAAGRRESAAGRITDVLVDTATIAGTANLVNLLDLRPGRAVKVAALLALGGLGHGSAGALGAAAGAAPVDLAGRGMLGDCGANALGAAVATSLVARLPRPARLAVLTAVAALNLASERVSFTAFIERTPWLDRVDRLGR